MKLGQRTSPTTTNKRTIVAAQGLQLWRKLKHQASRVGQKGIIMVLKLYYSAQDSDTPAWAKAAIYTAIAYFILPLDAVPDFLLGGYSDDLATLSAALITVASHVKPEHQQQAEAKAQQWLSPKQTS